MLAGVLLPGGAGLVLVAWLAYAARESPLAVVADLPTLGIVLAVSGSAIVLFAARRAAGDVRGALHRAAAYFSLLAGLVVLGRLLWFSAAAFQRREVSFQSGGAVLAGTVYLPRGGRPTPGAVLVHGSGPETRGDYAFYARYLARRGVAALAFDKRGTGESTGRLYAAGYGSYADDVLAAVRTLDSAPAVATVGLVGFSEAEWVAPLAATRSATIGFIAIVGASGLTPAEQVTAEMEMRLQSHGYGDSVVRRALRLHERVLGFQRSGVVPDDLEDALEYASVEPWFEVAEDLSLVGGPPGERRWWRSVMDFDPAPYWEDVRVPVLLLKGGRDDRSSALTMRARIPPALSRGGNGEVEVRLFPNADHLLLEWPRGEGELPPRFAPGYLDTLVAWIIREASGRGAGAAVRHRRRAA